MKAKQKWLDYPTCEGWWLWNGDQNDGEILLVIGSPGDFEIADDEILEYYWDKSIMKNDFENCTNYWDMTPCADMDHGQWQLVKKLERESD